jgi:hypothetical protein
MSFIKNPSLDKNIMTYDPDVDITIAAGDHAHTTDEMYRSAVVYGDTAMRVVQNDRQHGLSKVQIGVSTTPHGECRWLRSDGAELIELRIPTEQEVRMELARQVLGEDESEELVARTAALIPRDVMNGQLFQRSGGRVLSKTLPDVSDELLFELEPGELETLLEAMLDGGFEEAAAKTILRLGLDVSSERLELVVAKLLSQEATYEAPEMSEELPSWGVSMSPELKEKVASQFQVRSLDLRGPAPAELKNWGIPDSVYPSWCAGKRMYEGFLDVLRAEGTPMTCALLAEMIQEEFGIERPRLRAKGGAEATYKVVEGLILEQHRAQDQAHMRWVNGGDPVSRSLNLGDHVRALCDWTGAMDARPRPTMSDEPLSEEALGDFEVAALKQDLMRTSTPRDTMVPLAELSPFWAESCWEALEDGTFSGHPAGFWLNTFVNALLTEQDELFTVDSDGFGGGQKTDIERLLLHPCHPSTLYRSEEAGCVMESIQLDGDEWRVLSRNSDGTVTARRTKSNQMPWATVELDENHPAVQAGHYVAGEVVFFWSRVGMLAFQAKYARTPAVRVSDLGLPIVQWDLVMNQFPKVAEFMDWATEMYDGEAQEADDEVREYLMEIAAELSRVQNQSLKLLTELNAEVNAGEFLNLLAEATRLVGENPTIVTSKDFEGREGRTSLWGLLNESLIETVKNFGPSTAVLPEPRRIIGTDLITGDQMWGTNWNLVFRAMGYNINPKHYQPGRDGLIRMVGESLNRPNPANPEGLRVLFGTAEDGSTMRKFQKRSLTPWAELGAFSNGLLGDMLADWWANSVGFVAPSGVNLATMSSKELEKFLGCTSAKATQMVQAIRCCSRIPRHRKMTLASLLDKVLPLPNPVSEGYLDAVINRMCVMSKAPLLTMQLVQTALGAVESPEIAAARVQILSAAPRVGRETTQDILQILN